MSRSAFFCLPAGPRSPPFPVFHDHRRHLHLDLHLWNHALSRHLFSLSRARTRVEFSRPIPTYPSKVKRRKRKSPCLIQLISFAVGCRVAISLSYPIPSYCVLSQSCHIILNNPRVPCIPLSAPFRACCNDEWGPASQKWFEHAACTILCMYITVLACIGIYIPRCFTHPRFPIGVMNRDKCWFEEEEKKDALLCFASCRESRRVGRMRLNSKKKKKKGKGSGRFSSSSTKQSNDNNPRNDWWNVQGPWRQSCFFREIGRKSWGRIEDI